MQTNNYSPTIEKVRERLAQFKGSWPRVAKLAGVSPQFVRKLANGQCNDPSFILVERVALVCGMSLNWKWVEPMRHVEPVTGTYKPITRDPNTIDYINGKPDSDVAGPDGTVIA